ncbi:hypothetical protein D7S86_09420 [Pararobbsia silviterrae]|uniref:Uncharacterized protein n=1 Tax=Pararobbsia silviterrae TaxID=1792498 RepID=A0A494Y1J8_9BURK|nr:hypothetical protein D7S86_09420 [Pararobbsia silviterrae]
MRDKHERRPAHAARGARRPRFRHGSKPRMIGRARVRSRRSRNRRPWRGRSAARGHARRPS